MNWPYRDYSTYLGRWLQAEKLGMIPNDTVDFNDLTMFVGKWCEKEFLLAEDLNRDGVVDSVDYTILAGHWLEGTTP